MVGTDVMDLMVIGGLTFEYVTVQGETEEKMKRKPPQRGLGERDVEVKGGYVEGCPGLPQTVPELSYVV